MTFSWKCPYCNQNATITSQNYSVQSIYFDEGNKHGTQKIEHEITVCPNKSCGEYVLNTALYNYKQNRGGGGTSIKKKSWQLIPPGCAKVFPNYIPRVLISDYEEACLIKTQSPKASATLSRRCLQGMIRDFWGIQKNTLKLEIDALEEKVDQTTWLAIEGIRKIGNIGAHMEKDINKIVDVDPDEAQLLIGLIETLLEDWYIAKHEREQRFTKVIELSRQKIDSKADLKSKQLEKVVGDA